MDDEGQQISYEQFQSDCKEIQEISDKLGDSWQLHDSVGNNLHLELQQYGQMVLENDCQSATVQTQYQVHYSFSFGVPVLLCRFSHLSGELIDYGVVRERLLGTCVTTDMISMAPHPLTGLPWLQVHPCRTAATTGDIRKHCSDQTQCNYVITFLSFYGQALGLCLSPKYATLHRASNTQ